MELAKTNSQNPFIVNMNAVVVAKIIVDATIPLVRALHINLLNFLCNLLIFYGPGAFVAGQPPVICRLRYPK